MDRDPETDAELDTLLEKVQQLQSTVTTLANIGQLSKLLDDIATTQNGLDIALENYVSRSTFQHHSNIRSLEISRVELSSTLNHSRNLKSIMENANDLSYKITENVRVLDAEKVQLIQVKEHVDNVKTLKAELSTANEAILRKDWLSAAKSISIIRKLPEGIINDEFVEFKVPTSNIEDLPSDLLSRWIADLEKVFTEEFNDAATNKDVTKLTYFFQLFPLIGKDNVGLKCYSRFICGIISEQSRSIIRKFQNTQSKPDFYAQLLFTLYQTISGIISQHSPVIKTCYGKQVVNSILRDIQNECDLQSNLIYETYCDYKQLDRLLEDIKQYDYPVLIREIYKNATESESEDEDEHEEEDDAVELLEVSQVTDELSAMMSHWSMYSRFFVVVWNSNLENGHSDNPLLPTPLLLSSFGVKVESKVVSQFDTCCTFIIRRTLEKACTMETLGNMTSQFSVCLKFLTSVFKKIEHSTTHSLYTLIPEDPTISSLADDIIIVLNTIISEVLATGELSSIKNMVSNIKRILMNDFFNIIQQKFKSLNLKTTSNLLSKETIQKIHQQQNPLAEKSSYGLHTGSNPRSRSTTPINVSASDIANTGAMFMRSLNAAISYGTSGDDNAESYLIGEDSDIKPFVIYMNTLDVMCSYLDRLVESCMNSSKLGSLLIVNDKEVNTIRKSLDQSESLKNMEKEFDVHVPADEDMRSRVDNLLKSIPSAFRERSESMINHNVKQLFDRVIKARILRLLNNSIADNYAMVVEDGLYYSLESNILNGPSTNNVSGSSRVLVDGAKIATFIKNWNSLIIPFATTLSNNIFMKLISRIVEISATVLENKIWQLEKKVTSAGALKLEQDISTIISELTKFNYGLRSNFVKVTQIIMMVGLDEEEEVSAFEDSTNGIEWALTPSERVRARKLRSAL